MAQYVAIENGYSMARGGVSGFVRVPVRAHNHVAGMYAPSFSIPTWINLWDVSGTSAGAVCSSVARWTTDTRQKRPVKSPFLRECRGNSRLGAETRDRIRRMSILYLRKERIRQSGELGR